MSRMDIDESSLNVQNSGQDEAQFRTPLPHPTPSKHKKPKSKLFPAATDREDNDLTLFNKQLAPYLQVTDPLAPQPRRIGNSVISEVWLVHQDSKPVALKKLKTDLLQAAHQRDKAIHEFTFAANLHHPNLIKYLKLFREGSNIAFLIEYCDLGSLDNFLTSERYKNYTPADHKGTDKFWYFADDLLKGLQKLHDYGYLHLDLKPANILLAKNEQSVIGCTMKIGDFGSMWKVDTTNPNDLASGDGRYQAPEIAEKWQEDDQRPTYETDIYSLGLVFFEMLYQNLFPNISKITPDDIDVHLPNTTIASRIQLKKMIHSNPVERPRTRDLLECIKKHAPSIPTSHTMALRTRTSRNSDPIPVTKRKTAPPVDASYTTGKKRKKVKETAQPEPTLAFPKRNLTLEFNELK